VASNFSVLAKGLCIVLYIVEAIKAPPTLRRKANSSSSSASPSCYLPRYFTGNRGSQHAVCYRCHAWILCLGYIRGRSFAVYAARVWSDCHSDRHDPLERGQSNIFCASSGPPAVRGKPLREGLKFKKQSPAPFDATTAKSLLLTPVAPLFKFPFLPWLPSLTHD
jgi:hypothetical protein